jgi:hypothetical protein
VENFLENEEVKDEIVQNLLAFGKKPDKKSKFSSNINSEIPQSSGGTTNVQKILSSLNSNAAKPLSLRVRDVERELVRLGVSYNNVVKSVKDDEIEDKGTVQMKNEVNVGTKTQRVELLNPSEAEINAFSLLFSRGGGGLKLENFLMIVNYFSNINRFIINFIF